MNKKGIIALVVIIVLVVLGFSLFGGDDVATNPGTDGTSTPVEIPAGVEAEDYAPVTSEQTDTTLLGRLKRASVSATEDGSRVALSNGTATFTIAGTSDKGTITLGDVAVETKAGGRNDVLATLTVKAGNANSYGYVVLFEDKSGSLADRSYALIGDRVTITGVRADDVGDADYVVSVSYRDRDGANRTKILVVENGAFNAAKEISL